jgi:hypothetical protein
MKPLTLADDVPLAENRPRRTLEPVRAPMRGVVKVLFIQVD